MTPLFFTSRLPISVRTGGVAVLAVAVFAFPSLALAQSSSGGGGAAVGGAAGCAAGLLGGLVASKVGAGVAAGSSAAFSAIAVQTVDITQNTILGDNLGLHYGDNARDNILSCLARSVARVALEQITASTVNWINSGFNGSPAFISNYNRFFTNIADQAAGQFIQGSDLAFLCSPFQLQVKIAVAQSYANRYDHYNNSCTLTSVTGNINGFINSFAQGGWPAFISFTTMPTNNPYGAFMYAEAGLRGAVQNAQGTQQLDLQLGNGFLSVKKDVNCQTYTAQTVSNATPKKNQSVDTIKNSDGSESYRICDVVNTTPGTAVAETLNKAIGAGPDSLIQAKYFDEIIGALITQLIQRTLYAGLSSLSGSGSNYENSFGQTQASLSGQAGVTIVEQSESAMQIPQQLIALNQQNLAFIAQSKKNLQAVDTCWIAASSNTAASDEVRTSSKTHASTTEATIATLNTYAANYNDAIADEQDRIDTLDQFSQQAQNTRDISAIQNLTQELIQFISNSMPTPNDLFAAQQNQAQLQTFLATTDTATAASLAECTAARGI